jgi:hypothetical protein
LRPIAGGEHVLWAFSEAQIGGSRYLFRLVNPSLGGETDATLQLDHQLRGFGRQLRADAGVAHTYRSETGHGCPNVISVAWMRFFSVVR